MLSDIRHTKDRHFSINRRRLPWKNGFSMSDVRLDHLNASHSTFLLGGALVSYMLPLDCFPNWKCKSYSIWRKCKTKQGFLFSWKTLVHTPQSRSVDGDIIIIFFNPLGNSSHSPFHAYIEMQKINPCTHQWYTELILSTCNTVCQLSGNAKLTLKQEVVR